MGLLTFVGRVVLVVMNIVFIITSLCMIAAGFVLRYGHEFLRTRLKSVLEDIESKVKTLYADSDFNTDSLDFGELVGTLATVLIVVGVFLLAMSFVGCCGACCNIGTIMLVYAIVLIVILVAQVAVVIVVFGAPDVLKKYLKDGLEESLDEYDGLKGTKLSTLSWNWAMQQYACCGATNYEDFKDKGTWKAADSDTTEYNAVEAKVLIPVACCATLPGTTADQEICAGSDNNTAYDTVAELTTGTNKDDGCVDGIWEGVITSNVPYFLTVVGICAACQIVIIIFAILVYKDRGVSGGLV